MAVDEDMAREYAMKQLEAEESYDLSYAALNHVYSEDEPEYNDADLVWKNTNYIPPKELPKV